MKKECSQQDGNKNSQNTHRNRYNSSVLEQLSQTSRQNLQHQGSNYHLFAEKYQSQYQDKNVYSSSKENIISTQHSTTSKLQNTQQANNLKAQNDALKFELENQKRKYQQEINKLKRNISLKDQLLDQCESEINHLKNTYRTFISQFPRITVTQNPPENAKEIATDRQHQSQGRVSKQATKNSEGNLIPLSIVTKGMSKSGSSTKLGGQKLTHGLMRGRV